MQRWSISCPHCGYQVASGSGSRGTKIGNPFKRCPFCGNVSIDSDVREWITMSPFYRFCFIVAKPFWVSCLLFLILVSLLTSVFEESLLGGIVSLNISISIFIVFSLYSKKSKEPLIDESLKRTSNKSYVEMLKSAKITIYPIKGAEVGVDEDECK